MEGNNLANNPNRENENRQLKKEFKIKGTDNKLYKLIIIKERDEIIFESNLEDSIYDVKYTASICLNKFYSINKIFRRFDSINNLFLNFFNNINDRNIIITISDNKIKLIFKENNDEIYFMLEPNELKIENMLQRICDKIKDIDILKNDIINLKNENNNLKNENNNLKNENNNLKNELIKQKNDNDKNILEIKNEISNIKKIVEKNEEDKNKLKNELMNKDNQIKKMEKDIEEQNNRNVQHINNINENKKLIENLKNEIEILKTENINQNTQINNQKIEIENTNNKFNLEINNIKKIVDKNEEDKKMFNNDLLNKDNEIKKILKNIEEQNNKNEQHKKNINENTNKIEKLNREIEKLKTENLSQNTQISNQKIEIENTNNKLNINKNDIKKIVDKNEEEKKKFKNDLKNNDNEIKRMLKSIEEITNKSEKNKNNINQNKSEIKLLKDGNTYLNNQFRNQTLEIEKMNNKFITNNQELSTIKTELNKIEYNNKINYKFEKEPQNLKFKLDITNTNTDCGWNDIFEVFYCYKDNIEYIISPHSENFNLVVYTLLYNQKKTSLIGHKNNINTVRYFINRTNYNEYLISGDDDKIVIIWDITNNFKIKYQIITKYENDIFSCLLIFPHNNYNDYIVTSTFNESDDPDKSATKIYSLNNGQFIKYITGSNNSSVYYLLSWYNKRNNKYYIIQFSNKKIIINNLCEDELYSKLINKPEGIHHCGFIYNKNDNDYLCSSSTNGFINIWDLYQKTIFKVIDTAKYKLAHIIEWNSKYIIAANLDKKSFKIINLEQNQIISDIQGQHNKEVICIKKIYHPIYGESLLTAGEDKFIKLWSF